MKKTPQKLQIPQNVSNLYNPKPKESPTIVKTKWQQLLEAPKGGLEFNPKESFCLQVFWVVRSITAAKEMIIQGFNPCANATMKNTPTTLAYFFRVAKDQSLAEKFKSQVKTIGQHPHYQSAFKSIELGIARGGVEAKMRLGGVDTAPLDWSQDELISAHQELDFNPVVLECTEIYLDSRSFFEHGASSDWMKAYPEIMKMSRSLKPTTFSLGHPTKYIWETTLESSLKAIQFNNDERSLVSSLRPGVFFMRGNNVKVGDQSVSLFLELDLKVEKSKLESLRSHLDQIQKELGAPHLIVMPKDNETLNGDVGDIEIRVMLVVCIAKGVNCLNAFKERCKDVQGRVILFELERSAPDALEKVAKRREIGNMFLVEAGLNGCVEVLDGHEAERDHLLSGYTLHPLFNKIVEDENFEYKI